MILKDVLRAVHDNKVRRTKGGWSYFLGSIEVVEGVHAKITRPVNHIVKQGKDLGFINEIQGRLSLTEAGREQIVYRRPKKSRIRSSAMTISEVKAKLRYSQRWISRFEKEGWELLRALEEGNQLQIQFMRNKMLGTLRKKKGRLSAF